MFLWHARNACAGMMLFGVMAPIVSATTRRGATAAPGLSESDLAIARLGERFRSRDPEAASGLERWAARQLFNTNTNKTKSCDLRRAAAAARQRLLEPGRLAREFEREEVEMADGWLLARSEVALAVHLAALNRAGVAGDGVS